MFFIFSVAEMSSQVYFRNPFRSICNCKQLTEYTVMNIEYINEKDIASAPGHYSTKVSSRLKLSLINFS